MKKIFLLFTALFSTIIVLAQPSNITGTTDPNEIKKVSLFKVLNGRLIEIATSNTDEIGRFAFRFTPEYEGFYVLGSGTTLRTQGNFRFYFKGNEDLTIKLNRENYELVQTDSPEIKALNQWDIASNDMALKAHSTGGMSTYVDFFPQVEEMNKNLNLFKKDPKTGNKVFDKLFPSIVENEFAYNAISYNYMPRQAHPDKEEFSSYYQNFNADKYLTDQLLTLPFGDRFMTVLLMEKNRGKGKLDEESMLNAIPSDVLKGQFIASKMERARSMEEFLLIKAANQKFLTLPEQLKRAEIMEAKLAETKTGVPAVSFSYPDVNGKNVALKDLKGKVVLVDLWATWCGPCLAQEPHWEKLYEEYKDKEVAFVGISIDKDKSKWVTHVKEKNTKGIQLHSGVENVLSAAYKVDGIPRYILIDKAGNLIAADSPRPSDPKLKELLEIWIKK